MILTIIDTQKQVEHEVSWVEINTPVGNMIIQEGHAPMIIELSLKEELNFQLASGKRGTIIVPQGVAHVTRKDVKVLIPIQL